MLQRLLGITTGIRGLSGKTAQSKQRYSGLVERGWTGQSTERGGQTGSDPGLAGAIDNQTKMVRTTRFRLDRRVVAWDPPCGTPDVRPNKSAPNNPTSPN